MNTMVQITRNNVLPSQLDMGGNYRGQMGDIDGLAKDIAINTLQTPPTTIKKTNGKFYILDGDRRVEACKRIENNNIKDEEGNPYPLSNVNFRIAILPKPFEQWTQNEILLYKLSANNTKRYTKQDLGNILQLILDNISVKEKEKMYANLTKKEQKEIQKKFEYVTRSICTYKEARKAINSARKAGSYRGTEELEPFVSSGEIGEETRAQAGTLIGRLPKPRTKKKLIEEIKASTEKYKNSQIRYALVATTRLQKKDKRNLDIPKVFREQLVAQQGMTKIEIINASKEHKDKLKAHARNIGTTLSGLLNDLIYKYIQENKL